MDYQKVIFNGAAQAYRALEQEVHFSHPENKDVTITIISPSSDSHMNDQVIEVTMQSPNGFATRHIPIRFALPEVQANYSVPFDITLPDVEAKTFDNVVVHFVACIIEAWFAALK